MSATKLKKNIDFIHNSHLKTNTPRRRPICPRKRISCTRGAFWQTQLFSDTTVSIPLLSYSHSVQARSTALSWNIFLVKASENWKKLNNLDIINSLKAVGGRILPNNCLDLPQLLLGEPLEHAGGPLRAPVVSAWFERDFIPLLFAEVHLMVSWKLVAWQAFVIWTVQDKHLWQQISVSFLFSATSV